MECVAFDSAEESLAAGATGGTIKLWDLEQAKGSSPCISISLPQTCAIDTNYMPAVIRTLTGHRSTCSSIDCHPFGDFFASGSLDTTLKVWDIRRKTCISTYKRHTRGVTKTAFSPDGRLIASSAQNGAVKVKPASSSPLTTVITLNVTQTTPCRDL